MAHLATVFGSFFKALLGLCAAVRMAGSGNDRSPIMPVQHPVYSGLGYFAPHFGLKCLLNLTYNQNTAMSSLVQKFREELTFLRNGHVAGTATAPVAVLRLLSGAEFLPQLDYCYTRAADYFPSDAVRNVEKARDQNSLGSSEVIASFSFLRSFHSQLKHLTRYFRFLWHWQPPPEWWVAYYYSSILHASWYKSVRILGIRNGRGADPGELCCNNTMWFSLPDRLYRYLMRT